MNRFKAYILIVTLLTSFFLLFYRLSDLMIFIGDQGWFYLSARDMILTGEVPLVGITSSHTWLHQGALWTYLLGTVLWIFKFDPLAGAYISVILTLISVFFVYKIGKELFSARVGLIAAFFYATSPLVIIHGRMPYHTNPIALLTILLLVLVYRWTKGNPNIFPLIVFILALLYNFELAAFLLSILVLVILCFGFLKKKDWALKIINVKSLLLSCIAYTIPMVPMIIYDIGHGFPQTLKFLVWVGYKITVTLHLYPSLHPNAPSETYMTMFPFATMLLQRLLFLNNALVAWILLFVVFSYLLAVCVKHIRKDVIIDQYSLLLLFFIVPLAGYITAKTNSEAYLIIFFPTIMLMMGIFFDRLMRFKHLFLPFVFVVLIIGFFNSYLLINQNYVMGKNGYGPTIIERKKAAEKIVSLANDKPYNLIGKGDGSQYESYTMNYEYLTWILGHPPSKDRVGTKIIVSDQGNQVFVERQRSK